MQTDKESWEADIGLNWYEKNQEVLNVNKILLITEWLAFCDCFCLFISRWKTFVIVYTFIEVYLWKEGIIFEWHLLKKKDTDYVKEI